MNMTSCAKVISCLAVLVSALAVAAQDQRQTNHQEQQTALSQEAVLQKLKETFGKDAIEKVVPSTVLPGWYDVVTPGELAYVNQDASVVFAGGKLIDAASKKDLTAERWSELNRIAVDQLPLGNAIKTIKGNGKRVLYLFSDPDCPFCQQLEVDLKDITDVTIYTFLYPLESLHPEARSKANALWCSKDQAKVWQDWMLNRVLPAATCTQKVIDENLVLGARYKINSTPTLVFADGRRVSGALDKKTLEQVLTASLKQ